MSENHDSDFQAEDFREENKCDTCNKKSNACISIFAYENAMMHKDMDNERLHETMNRMSEQHTKDIRNIIIGFFVVILLFVVSYTVRTNIWNETVRQMNAAVVELANAQNTGSP